MVDIQRMQHDPTDEQCPDYSLPLYLNLRTRWIGASQTTQEEAVGELADLWRADHQTRCDNWLAQQEADRAVRDAAQAAAREEEENREAERRRQEQAERLEAERKKPKMSGFDPNRTISSHISPSPSPYALSKLEKFEYLELWYFTQRGLSLAALEVESAKASYTIEARETKDGDYDNRVEVKRSTSDRPSKHVVKDHELSWCDFDIGKTNFLSAIRKAAWPESHIECLVSFFVAVETHHYRQRPHGDATMLKYASVSRRDWHQALDRGEGYNLALISDKLVRELHDDTLDGIKLQGMTEVSFVLASFGQLGFVSYMC